MKKYTAKDVANKLKENNRTDIELCEDTFIGWNKKANFYDFIAKDFFEVVVKNLFLYNLKHPNRKTAYQYVDFQKAKQRFDKQGRTDIELCEDDYISWSKKGVFYDKIEKKYFTARVVDVFLNKNVHPNRSQKKREKTFLKQFGANNPMKNENIKIKYKNVIKNKYGVEHPSQIKESKEKSKQTCLKKYGTEYPLQSEKIKNQSKQTCLKKYGTEYSSQSEKVKNKVKQTCLKKYGTEYFLNTIVNKKTIIETGQNVCDWLLEQNEPKPHKDHLNKIIGKFETVSIQELENYLEKYRSYKSGLEIQAEQLFNTKHYNKKPKQIEKLYRPDFKITDTVYVNVDGLYWHSELHKDKYYHFNMRKHFEENNIRIIQFLENEIRDKPEICKSIIDNIVGKAQNKRFVDNFIIKPVSQQDAQIFSEQNHLLGSVTAKHFGLYYNTELVSILSFRKKKHKCEIKRFCSLIDYNIAEMFSKLLEYLELSLKDTITEIYIYVDLRHETENHLVDNGFIYMEDVLNYKWTNGYEVFNKKPFEQYADELDWYKIYDAGQRNYIKYL